ncbi:hypothetical protein BJ508DRAFT_344068 [Ascobolus immersus RN42]|uniref:Uncharacterized protein n=1 Tax=Ascobolus immersus RN42 TaxID=1160509 RepID=A0A3N4IAR1_ASCIM|nr:hypothetical protein BJ508DRAFT_344068 [Ascobolus immersus RN42]
MVQHSRFFPVMDLKYQRPARRHPSYQIHLPNEILATIVGMIEDLPTFRSLMFVGRQFYAVTQMQSTQVAFASTWFAKHCGDKAKLSAAIECIVRRIRLHAARDQAHCGFYSKEDDDITEILPPTLRDWTGSSKVGERLSRVTYLHSHLFFFQRSELKKNRYSACPWPSSMHADRPEHLRIWRVLKWPLQRRKEVFSRIYSSGINPTPVCCGPKKLKLGELKLGLEDVVLGHALNRHLVAYGLERLMPTRTRNYEENGRHVCEVVYTSEGKGGLFKYDFYGTMSLEEAIEDMQRGYAFWGCWRPMIATSDYCLPACAPVSV